MLKNIHISRDAAFMAFELQPAKLETQNVASKFTSEITFPFMHTKCIVV